MLLVTESKMGATMTKKTTKLSKAQEQALQDISQSGGHGYGAYAYLGTRTAQALARKGLVTLGYRQMAGGEPMLPWAVATGAEDKAVYGWISQADYNAEWDRGMAELHKRAEARRAALVEEVRKARIVAGKPCPAEWEAKLNELISKHGPVKIREAFEAQKAAKGE